MHRLCVIPGDGIGTEVVPIAVDLLAQVVPDLQVSYAEAGWACFEEHGTSVPQETLDQLRQCGAGLFGATASPLRKVQGYRSAVLRLRQELDLYANLRPSRSIPDLTPGAGVDLLVVRENTEGLYVGQERREGNRAIAERVITAEASARIARVALDLASQRRGQLSIVHKANVLPLTCGLFRDTVRAVAEAFPQVTVSEKLVDLAALQLVSQPETFDVVVTTNLFGDILSDLSSYWMGGLGLAPSLNLGEGIAVAEPVHGTAPDIVGKGLANPAAAILSAAMLCRYHWQLPEAADRLETAVTEGLRQTGIQAGTKAITTAITHQLHRHALAHVD